MGRVSYELNVHLKGTAPAGYLNDQLVLVTNDTRSTKIPIQVEGRIVPEISVSPRSLVLGEVHSGKEISKNLVVRSNSKKPFRIVDIRCDDDCFTFKSDGEAKPLHSGCDRLPCAGESWRGPQDDSHRNRPGWQQRDSGGLCEGGSLSRYCPFMCPECGKKTNLFNRGGRMALVLEMNVPFLGHVPTDSEAATVEDAGMPPVRDGTQS